MLLRSADFTPTDEMREKRKNLLNKFLIYLLDILRQNHKAVEFKEVKAAIVPKRN